MSLLVATQIRILDGINDPGATVLRHDCLAAVWLQNAEHLLSAALPAAASPDAAYQQAVSVGRGGSRNVLAEGSGQVMSMRERGGILTVGSTSPLESLYSSCLHWLMTTKRNHRRLCLAMLVAFGTQGEARVTAALLAELTPWATWLQDFMRHFLQCLRSELLLHPCLDPALNPLLTATALQPGQQALWECPITDHADPRDEHMEIQKHPIMLTRVVSTWIDRC